MSREEKVVCVTGASGYIAAWLVKLLLQSGYTVKATVRDASQCSLSPPIYINLFKIQVLYCVSISKFILSDFIFQIYEMDEMVNAYTYQYGYFVVDFRRNGKWHIVWFGLTHSRHEIDVWNTIFEKTELTYTSFDLDMFHTHIDCGK